MNTRDRIDAELTPRWGEIERNVPCVTPSCENVVPAIFAEKVGTKFCVCYECVAGAEDAPDTKRRSEERERTRFEVRMTRRGVPALVAVALGLTWDNQSVDLVPGENGEREGPVHAAQRFVDARQRGILILSGSNGTGKTVTAGWLAWVTAGRFVGRGEWSAMTTWGAEDAADMRELIVHPGVIVLDEVVNPAHPETGEAAKLVATITAERHENGLGTVLTTRATKAEFCKVHGLDLLDRTNQHAALAGSGWIDCVGRSARAPDPRSKRKTGQ